MKSKVLCVCALAVMLTASPAHADQVAELLSDFDNLIGEASQLLDDYRVTEQDSSFYPYEVAFDQLAPVVADSLGAIFAELPPEARSIANDMIATSGYLEMVDAYNSVAAGAAVFGSLELIELLFGIVEKVKKFIDRLIEALWPRLAKKWKSSTARRLLHKVDDLINNILFGARKKQEKKEDKKAPSATQLSMIVLTFCLLTLGTFVLWRRWHTLRCTPLRRRM